MERVIAGRSPVRHGLCLLGLALGLVAVPFAPAMAAADGKVDVALVLGVDVSWSMDHHEQLIQRDGYAAAFRSKEVVNAIRNGAYGKVAVTYVEWAGATTQITVVPWTVIDGAAAAQRFADALKMQEPMTLRRTSISGAIDFARKELGSSGFTAMRRIIDISGDGPNNDGRSVTAARDEAVKAGITINGLPLMTNTAGSYGGMPPEDLDQYYTDCVIGGGQAFVIPVTSWAQFPKAVRRKLVLELAGTAAPDSVINDAGTENLPVIRVQATAPKATPGCESGEGLWRPRNTPSKPKP
jgi:hypothetical protein